MITKRLSLVWFSRFCVMGFLFGTMMQAQAVPSFARQTGMDCVACHTSFPELTPFGREFKLRGYTLGERQWLPFAAMAQLSVTNLSKKFDNAGVKQISRQNDPQFDSLSLFAAGKLSDYAGMFVQWTYSNNSEQREDGSIRHHSQLDNTDIRVVGNHEFEGRDLVYGVTLNNNPTVQDAWNTIPAWGYPYNGPNVPHPGPTYSSMIDGGLSQQVAGLGGYLWWNKHLYGELSFYGNADGLFRVLSEGQSAYRPIQGRNNPYWRLGWNEDWGAHSLMLGTYGLQVDSFQDNVNGTGPTDRFTDIAVDAQYQYISDPGIFSVQTTFIHEKQDWRGNLATCDPTLTLCRNKNDHLNTFKVKASYLYDRKYGATLAYFSTTGSSDEALYGGVTDVNTGSPVSTRPDNRGYIAQIDYNPRTNIRISLQYIGYTKWDGASHNIDGNGRSPHDNDTLFLNTWFAF